MAACSGPAPGSTKPAIMNAATNPVTTGHRFPVDLAMDEHSPARTGAHMSRDAAILPKNGPRGTETATKSGSCPRMCANPSPWK